MTGTWRGHHIKLFDFEPDIKEDSKPEDRRTAVCLSSERLRWPRTTIRPYETLDQVANWFFDDTPLNKRAGDSPPSVVEGDDLNWPGLVDMRLAEFLRENPDLTVHLGAGALAIYCNHRPLDVVELVQYLEKAEAVFEIAADSAEPAPLTSESDSNTKTDSFLITSQRPRLQRLLGVMFILLVMLLSGLHFRQAYLQALSRDFSVTQGWMTRVEFDDVGDADHAGGAALIAMQYQYIVNGHVYHGTAANRRFVWRPIRIGDDKSQQLKKFWRQGSRASVFYNPNAPQVSVLDNSYTVGDGNLVKLLGMFCVAGICYLAWPVWMRIGATIASWHLRRAEMCGDGNQRYPLPLVPYTLDLATVIFLPVGALTIIWSIALVIGDAPWLDTGELCAICLLAFTPAALVVVYWVELRWRGPDSGYLLADSKRRQLHVPQPGTRSPLILGFDQIKSSRIRETARDRDTISMLNCYDAILSYENGSGVPSEVVITRLFSRKIAWKLIVWLRSLADPGPLREGKQIR